MRTAVHWVIAMGSLCCIVYSSKGYAARVGLSEQPSANAQLEGLRYVCGAEPMGRHEVCGHAAAS